MILLAAMSAIFSIINITTNRYNDSVGEGIWGASVCWVVAGLGISASKNPHRSIVLSYFAVVCKILLIFRLNWKKRCGFSG